MFVLTDGNAQSAQQGAPPSDPVDRLYRDVLAKDSPDGSRGGAPTAQSDQSADTPRGEDQSGESVNPPPEPQEQPRSPRSEVPGPGQRSRVSAAPQHININQPIRTLCGTAGAGSEGPLAITGAIEVVSDEEILKNREPEEGIRRIPRFQNYQPGTPSKVPPLFSLIRPLPWKPGQALAERPSCPQVLCVKNLSGRVSLAQLVALFSRFERKDGAPVVYRLLTGRMKGQAFVTLAGRTAPPAPPHR